MELETLAPPAFILINSLALAWVALSDYKNGRTRRLISIGTYCVQAYLLAMVAAMALAFISPTSMNGNLGKITINSQVTAIPTIVFCLPFFALILIALYAISRNTKLGESKLEFGLFALTLLQQFYWAMTFTSSPRNGALALFLLYLFGFLLIVFSGGFAQRILPRLFPDAEAMHRREVERIMEETHKEQEFEQAKINLHLYPQMQPIVASNNTGALLAYALINAVFAFVISFVRIAITQQ